MKGIALEDVCQGKKEKDKKLKLQNLKSVPFRCRSEAPLFRGGTSVRWTDGRVRVSGGYDAGREGQSVGVAPALHRNVLGECESLALYLRRMLDILPAHFPSEERCQRLGLVISVVR